MEAARTKSRREEYSDATREALLVHSKALFAAHGYNGTSIEDVCSAVRVTRGALYHHFADKTALFEAVFVRVEEDAARHVEMIARKEPDPLKRFEVGLHAYLEACSDPAFRRIAIQEAPAALGLTRFREVDEENAQRLLVLPLAALKRSGELDVEDTVLLGRMISAMVWEAALLLDQAKNQRRLKRNAVEIVKRTLLGFRAKRKAPLSR